MPLPNGSPRHLTTAPSPGFELMPAVSPDGQWVAYVTWDDAQRGHVWKASLSGGTPQRLTAEAGALSTPKGASFRSLRTSFRVRHNTEVDR